MSIICGTDLSEASSGALEVARAHLDRIEALDATTVRSLLTVTREHAEAQAREADTRLRWRSACRCSATSIWDHCESIAARSLTRLLRVDITCPANSRPTNTRTPITTSANFTLPPSFLEPVDVGNHSFDLS